MPKAYAGSTKKNYPPAPAGVHNAICVDVIDLGEEVSPFKDERTGLDKIQHKIKVVWQINARREDNKLFTVSKKYTLSLHPKAKLRADLEAWRGQPFSDEDGQEGFDPEELKGEGCLLSIQHKKSADGQKTFANVVSIMPLMAGMPKLEAEEYKRWVPRAESGQDPAGDTAADDDIPF